MDLDARKPVLVILGAWNPAIFQPGWIARWLFSYPKGQDVTVATVAASGPELTLLTYLDNVGVGVSDQRLMIYANANSPTVFELAERVAVKCLGALSHTPVGAYGVNFSFAEPRATSDVLDRLRAKDGVTDRFKVTRERIASTIPWMDESQLNFTRFYEGEAAGFEFNFHFPKISADTAASQLNGTLARHLGYAMDLLEQLYGLNKTGVIGHALQSEVTGKEQA